jgi:hypothetical protein
MKSTFVLNAGLSTSSAILLAAASVAIAQETPVPQSSGRALMQHNANTSAQSTTDISYGGSSDTQGAAGGANPSQAAPDAQPANPAGARIPTQPMPSR